MSGKRVLRWLAVIGVVLHLAFWFTFGPFTSFLESAWRRAQDDPYAFSDLDLFRGLAAYGTLFLIYLPASILTLAVGLMCRWKGFREPSLWQVLGTAIGILTVAYVLFLWVFNV